MSESSQIVIFGASGDLTRRKLVPALAGAAANGSAKHEFSVIGVARRPKTDEEFREELRAALTHKRRSEFERLAPRIFYQPGDVGDPDSVGALSERLDALPGGREASRLFYLSLKPDLFPVATALLARAGLLEMREGARNRWRRVVVEKPFGHDLGSARRLNEELHAVLREDQIYRTDHYLGKETVQNLLGFRFHNAIFEPLWNRHHVELVQITVAEEIGVEPSRRAYYDSTGALRDMLQNHMLQILALVAMEPPASLDPEAVRNQKVELLRGLHCPDPREALEFSVRAQYGPGTVGEKAVPGYREEGGVPESQTETYLALRAEIANWRWNGVPFLLRHGKRLPRRFSEVQVQFRTPPLQLFNRPEGMRDAEFRRQLRDGSLCQIRPNVLTLAIQPQEAIRLSFGVKRPGAAMTMAPATLDFDYREHFGQEPPDAYERILLDALLGDQTLFLRADEIEACWRYADEVLEAWQGAEAPRVLEYPAGSWGPPEAEALFRGCEGGWSRG